MGMQQIEETELHELDHTRIDTAESLPDLNSGKESLAEVAHDARNMISALDLYCDLLQEPGVLTSSFSHYGSELKLVAAASRSLVEKLSILNSQFGPRPESVPGIDQIVGPVRTERQSLKPLHHVDSGIDNLAGELSANRNILSTIAGPFVSLTIDADGGALPVRMTRENLTRILVNLVRNATEAMSSVGRIHISLSESRGEPAVDPWLTLNIEDNGPGIADRLLDTIFERGQTTHVTCSTASRSGWPPAHRGLGLSITRSIVEAAGGRIHAANRDPVGACFQIELPVRIQRQ
jgi:signal transduction histidine kinase